SASVSSHPHSAQSEENPPFFMSLAGPAAARTGPHQVLPCAPPLARFRAVLGDTGGMAEWLKARAWKVRIRPKTVSWVRIPLPPPCSNGKVIFFSLLTDIASF